MSASPCLDRFGLLGELGRARSGSAATIFALALPAMVGLTGLGVEAGLWYAGKRQLQTVADAAATAGAFERASGKNDAEVTAAALDAAQKNGFTGAPTTIAIHNPPQSGPNAGDPTSVEAVVSQPRGALLASLFLPGGVTVKARSVATIKVTGEACVLALDPSASNAVTNSGSAIINMPGCVMAANSSSNSAISISGSATVDATSLWTAGGVTIDSSTNVSLERPPTEHAWAIDDPYADLTIPGLTGCTATNLSLSNVTQTLSPGVYCGGIDFGSKADITLLPGTYYINKGNIDINAQATVQGSGVTFVMTSTGAASDIGTVTINGGADVDLSAPSDNTADYPGVLFMQDRRAVSGGLNKLNGGSSMTLSGAVYFPSQEVEFNGNNSSGSNCTMVVALLVSFTGNSTFDDTGCEAAGVKPIQVSGVEITE